MSSTRTARAARGADEVPPGKVSISDKTKNEVFNFGCIGSNIIQTSYQQYCNYVQIENGHAKIYRQGEEGRLMNVLFQVQR